MTLRAVTGRPRWCWWRSTRCSRYSPTRCSVTSISRLPGWLGLNTDTLDVSMWQIARIVLIFLGVPLAAGWLTRVWGERTRGVEWYETRFLPRIAPWALYGLLFTVGVLFAPHGE